MPTRFEKTEAGQREIRDRANGLPRTARTLLVLTDGVRTELELLAMVNGSTPADLSLLLGIGLIAPIPADAYPVRPAATAPQTGSGEAGPGKPRGQQRAAAEAPPAAVPESGLSYSELYDGLNALAKEQLGLFKGYRFSLEVEKASGVEELRQVARQFVVEVRKAKGEAAAQMVQRALGLGP
jgi:hypothetical protein